MIKFCYTGCGVAISFTCHARLYVRFMTQLFDGTSIARGDKILLRKDKFRRAEKVFTVYMHKNRPTLLHLSTQLPYKYFCIFSYRQASPISFFYHKH